ncbi:reducing type I polyketide synthase [Durotheca rogersii]|uniref:reducing type I polyketide synthase n=1 Tax=Durotheca rogersii TaxID=419775 RepID=UPI002220F0A8|nr:reducing type I polyketide synthase [Durotheca rogersii]KAI5865333.1 reducing type I polyketide synthase [Durotheca rogersii]
MSFTTAPSSPKIDEMYEPSSRRQRGEMPIAIVGMSCRFPGDATSPERLWRMCAEGRSAWSEIPADRFNKDAFYHPSGDKPTTTNVRGGHFLEEDIGLFDATFFDMTPEMAATMDPQCRLQLETVYEALENAGMTLEKVAGSETSVFSGAFYRDYMDSLLRDPDELPRYVMVGNGATMMANRISHFYDLRGPSMTVDTGCSTGLVALHQACQSLKTNDARMAVVVGANIIMNPDIFVLWSSLGFLSPDGKCYAFDSRASGYGRGEGVSALILKPLSDAVRDGDPVHAVISQTALNQDGKTRTITSPSQQAQEDLMRLCYERAGLDPAETPYVEAHGTGTQAGDPTEAAAIYNVMCRGRTREGPLYIASVKTNVGHLETSSGFAAIIKVALALEKGLIPPSINFEVPNAKIPLDKWNLKIPRKLEPWPRGFPRRASINNFGYGGANAHVIMEAWQPHLSAAADDTKPASVSSPATTPSLSEPEKSPAVESRVFVLSARDEVALQGMVEKLQAYVSASEMEESEFVDRLAHTLSEHRSRFGYRITFSAPATKEGILSALRGESAKLTPARSSKVPRIGMVFTGQGAQWYAMGRELIGVYPVFTDTLNEADQALRDMGCPWSLIDELTKSEAESRVNDVVLSPPLCIAVQIALFRLLESWGVKATAVTSHSSGEIPAAYAAGLLDLREAVAIVYARGAFLESLQKEAHYRGGMIVAGIGREEADALIDGMGVTGQAVVACVNSPASVTISGDQVAIAKLESKLAEDKIFVRALKVPVAYHSHHMEPVAADYLAALNRVLSTKRPFNDVLYYSPVTGTRIHDASEIDPGHWVRNMLQRVEFVNALSAMCLSPDTPGERIIDTILEVGAHGALGGPIRHTFQLPELKDLGITYDSCLWRGKNAITTMHDLAASLVAKGYPVDLDAVNFPQVTKLRPLSNLPPYSWNHRTRHWYESRINKAHRTRETPNHDLLGSRLLGSSPYNPTWRHFIRPAEVPWVREHRVQSDIVYPGAGLVSMALEAMRQVTSSSKVPVAGFRLRNVEILHALVIPDTARGVEVQLTLNEEDGKTLGLQGWREFSIRSVSDETWIEHCKGLIAPQWAETDKLDLGISHDEQQLTAEDPDAVFEFFRSVGIHHGLAFRNLLAVKASQGRSVTTLAVADSAASMPGATQSEHLVHPTTLDSVIVAAYTSVSGRGTTRKSAMVPRSIKEMFISTDISRTPKDLLQVHSSLLQDSQQGFHASVVVRSWPTSTVAIEIDDLQCVSIGEVRSSETDDANKCLKIDWAEDLSLVSIPDLVERLKAAPDAHEVSISQDLYRACFYFFHDAVAALSPSDVEGLLWYHKIYYEWMKLQISSQPKASQWLSSSPEEREVLLKRVASASTSGEMVCRVGHQLAGILRQEIAPLELMLENQLLYSYYQNALHIGSSYQQVNKIVDLFAHKNPSARILEIGAGTGGCTKHVINALGGGAAGGIARFSHYDFTDISINFFEEARKMFSSWGELVDYRKLDIEADPASQGFEEGSYDLVVACQALHATKNMDNTMAHVRKLLKPDGKLIVVETTQDSPDIQLIFGVLPGWWLSEEPERKHSPSLTPSFWDTVLKRTGFSGIDLRVRDCEDDEKYVIDVIMSTASPDAAPDVAMSPSRQLVSVTCAEQDKIHAQWLGQLLTEIRASTSYEPIVEDIESLDPDGKFVILLDSVKNSILESPTSSQFRLVKSLVTRAQGVLWTSYGGTVDCENPVSALHSGFLRTLRCENVGKRYVSVDLEFREGNPWTAKAAQAVVQVLSKTFDLSRASNSIDFEYSVRGDSVLIPRVYDDEKKTEDLAVLSNKTATIETLPFYQQGRELRLEVAKPGMLDSLTFCDNPEAFEDLPEGFVEIEPRAFGLNFRDVMVAMGQLQTKVMCFECSGIVTKLGPGVSLENGPQVGDRVSALLRGHWANHTRTHWTSVTKIPDTMAFETAASIPVVFVTAYYSLHTLANIRRGERVLIHSAAGGVGQAAIQLAQLAGAEIFATVGSLEKEDFIATQYGIPRENIFSSRNVSFAQHVRQRTNGRGVDVVLNSLAGKMLHETWACIAPFGRFVEIGKRDFEQNNSLQMAPFVKATSFFAVDLFQMGLYKQDATFEAFTAVMDLFRDNRLRPIAPVTAYPISQLEKAFRTMQVGKHLGKIVIIPHADDEVKVRRGRVRLDPKASYLVVGGVGGIGKSIVWRLVGLGAKNLILVSRNAESTENNSFLDELKTKGINVLARSVDVADSVALATAVARIDSSMPQCKGVIQAAMVLQDSIVENMTHENYLAAVRPKVQGTWNLHNQFQGLDFFVMLSSLVGVGGNSSQSNYAAGGSFQDAVARHRSSKGLPAVSLDLGMIASVGYVARTSGVKDRLARQGYKLVSEDEVLRLVEDSIARPYRQQGQSQVLIGISTDMETVSRDDSPFVADVRFSGLMRESSSRSGGGSSNGKDGGASSAQDLSSSIAGAESLEAAVESVSRAIAVKMAGMFGLPEEEVSPTAPMSQYGVDSLVAVELRNWLSSATQSEVSVFEIMQSKSLKSLAAVACNKSRLRPKELQPAE